MSQINEYLVTAKCENAFTHKQSIVEMPAFATSRQSAENARVWAYTGSIPGRMGN